MSPEQAAGRALDFRSDQFSLGVILYEMATGKRAFERGSIAETLAAILRDEPESMSRLNPLVPPPLQWMVKRTHRVTGNLIYEFPFAKGSRGLKRTLLHG